MTDKEYMLLKLKYGRVNFNLLVLINVLEKNNINFTVHEARFTHIHINHIRIHNSSRYEGLMFVRGLGFPNMFCELHTLCNSIVDIIDGKVRFEDIGLVAQ